MGQETLPHTHTHTHPFSLNNNNKTMGDEQWTKSPPFPPLAPPWRTQVHTHTVSFKKIGGGGGVGHTQSVT